MRVMSGSVSSPVIPLFPLLVTPSALTHKQPQPLLSSFRPVGRLELCDAKLQSRGRSQRIERADLADHSSLLRSLDDQRDRRHSTISTLQVRRRSVPVEQQMGRREWRTRQRAACLSDRGNASRILAFRSSRMIRLRACWREGNSGD